MPKGVGSSLVHPGDDAKMRQGALEGGFPASSYYDSPQAGYVIKLIQLSPKSSRRRSRLTDPLNRVLLNQSYLKETTKVIPHKLDYPIGTTQPTPHKLDHLTGTT